MDSDVIYYAETSTRYGVEEFIGVFSSSEAAKKSCHDHAKKHIGQRIGFQGFGDRLEAVAENGRCYTILALELNREVWR